MRFSKCGKSQCCAGLQGQNCHEAIWWSRQPSQLTMENLGTFWRSWLGKFDKNTAFPQSGASPDFDACICHFLAPEVLVLVLATVKPNLEAGESFGDIAHSQTLLRNHTKQIANLRNCVAIPENLADGMVLVVDYWQSQNLNWLDGVGCGYGKEYCAVSYTGEMTR